MEDIEVVLKQRPRRPRIRFMFFHISLGLFLLPPIVSMQKFLFADLPQPSSLNNHDASFLALKPVLPMECIHSLLSVSLGEYAFQKSEQK